MRLSLKLPSIALRRRKCRVRDKQAWDVVLSHSRIETTKFAGERTAKNRGQFRFSRQLVMLSPAFYSAHPLSLRSCSQSLNFSGHRQACGGRRWKARGDHEPIKSHSEAGFCPAKPAFLGLGSNASVKICQSSRHPTPVLTRVGQGWPGRAKLFLQISVEHIRSTERGLAARKQEGRPRVRQARPSNPHCIQPQGLRWPANTLKRVKTQETDT